MIREFYPAVVDPDIGLGPVTGQNGSGQNGTDKMVRTKCNGQNGSNFYRFQLN